MKRLLVYSEIIKHLPRTGWKRKGVPEPETVASHSWQMALMALYLSQGNALEYDFDKVIKLCLCHDLAESKLGDITPIDAAYSSKAVRETAAMAEIAVEADSLRQRNFLPNMRPEKRRKRNWPAIWTSWICMYNRLIMNKNSRIRTWKNFAVLPPPESKRH